ncbi:GTPase [Tessaracoccus antarcticus]|uniref:ABC transporter n=1 Tax=Tessaracoccus antarcticus TaxID=2479848 RepID=A0A3M0GC32_9ACTN|nr:GTPase [Tessaracoccus antarcticus]RMB62330.1 ABC transporter [Tessaracoccus antarcticus]
MQPLAERLALVDKLLLQAAGRLPEEVEARARRVVAHAGQRMSFGPQTVVALAGATGSGKSSLFNALAGQDLAEVAARRPTTSQTRAVAFAPSDVALLDWLGIQRRNEVPPPLDGFRDLVLLDLPDHDSTEAAHRQEVDKMVPVVDQFIWVLDPQKYADAAVHERYLRPLARHRDVITVVLNQADRLSPEELRSCLADLRRLLADDGLAGVTVLATSARTGSGLEDLRRRLAALATAKTAAAARLSADVDVLASELAAAVSGPAVASPSKRSVASLEDSLAESAGVPYVVDAVRTSMLHRGSLATGWPLVKWLGRFKPDPLRRLRIGSGARHAQLEADVAPRSSLQNRGSIADARLRTGLRTLATELSDGLPQHWQVAIHDAVHGSVPTLPDTLDRAVVTADLHTDSQPLWWQVLKFLQWLLIAAVVVGLGWLTADVALAYFQLPRLPRVMIRDIPFPLPTLLVGGGLLVGLLLSIGSRVVVGLGARSKARRARAILRRRIAEVAQLEVVQPARAELDRLSDARRIVDKLA